MNTNTTALDGPVCRMCMLPATSEEGFCKDHAAYRSKLADNCEYLIQVMIQSMTEHDNCPYCGAISGEQARLMKDAKGKGSSIAPHADNRDKCKAWLMIEEIQNKLKK